MADLLSGGGLQADCFWWIRLQLSHKILSSNFGYRYHSESSSLVDSYLRLVDLYCIQHHATLLSSCYKLHWDDRWWDCPGATQWLDWAIWAVSPYSSHSASASRETSAARQSCHWTPCGDRSPKIARWSTNCWRRADSADPVATQGADKPTPETGCRSTPWCGRRRAGFPEAKFWWFPHTPTQYTSALSSANVSLDSVGNFRHFKGLCVEWRGETPTSPVIFFWTCHPLYSATLTAYYNSWEKHTY